MTRTSTGTACLFDLLDRWRHLPAYQLERRADIFFGLFLPEVLNDHLLSRGIEIDQRLIPEFPLGQANTKRSDKADFFALSVDRKHAFLIELKTDMRSLRNSQEDYLNRAVARGLAAILCDLRGMAKATDRHARRKYFHLLEAVAGLGLLRLPPGLEDKIHGPSRGVYDLIESIEVAPHLPVLEIIHVLPNASGQMNCIDFPSFACVVARRGKLGARFAESLREWSIVAPGERRKQATLEVE